MGEARRRQKRIKELIKEGTCCVICGGGRPADTVEHIPPRVFFINKYRPRSHEVPACKRCNYQSADADQIAALVCLSMAGFSRTKVPEDYFRKIATGVRKHHPAAYRYFAAGDAESIYPSGILYTRPIAVKVKVDDRLWTKYLNPWAAKQAVAIYYILSETALPETGSVDVRWFPNDQLLRHRGLIDFARKLGGEGALRMGKFDTSNQFFYRYEYFEESGLLVLCCGMHESSMMIAFVNHSAEARRGRPALRGFAQFRPDPHYGILGV